MREEEGKRKKERGMYEKGRHKKAKRKRYIEVHRQGKEKKVTLS